MTRSVSSSVSRRSLSSCNLSNDSMGSLGWIAQHKLYGVLSSLKIIFIGIII